MVKKKEIIEEPIKEEDYLDLSQQYSPRINQYPRLPKTIYPQAQQNQVTETLEKKIEDKKDKPNLWDRLWNKNKLKKGKSVAILFLKQNGIAEPMELESKKGFFEIQGQSYHEDKDCLWRISKTGVNLALIEEKSLLPIGTERWYEGRPLERTTDFMKRKLMEMQDHVLRAIRHAEFVRMGESDKSKWDTKTVIIVIIAVIIGISLMKGKGLF